MSNLSLNNNKNLISRGQKNIICKDNQNILGKYSNESDILKKKLKLDYLYFGYLGVLKQIGEDDYIFEQLSVDPVGLAYKDKIETTEYLDRVIGKKEQYKDAFNNQVYYSYNSQMHTIEDNQLVFAPLVLLSYYLPIKYRIKNEISYEDALTILESLNSILKDVNYNDTFTHGVKKRFYPERIHNVSKVEFKEHKPNKNELITDVNTNIQKLKKYQITLR